MGRFFSRRGHYCKNVASHKATDPERNQSGGDSSERGMCEVSVRMRRICGRMRCFSIGGWAQRFEPRPTFPLQLAMGVLTQRIDQVLCGIRSLNFASNDLTIADVASVEFTVL